MDLISILIFIVGIGLYFGGSKKSVWLFLSGSGLGILVGLLWAQYVINQALAALK